MKQKLYSIHLFYSVFLGFLIIFGLEIPHLRAQFEGVELLSPSQMREDVDSLKSYLFHTHTDPFQYTSREILDEAFHKLDNTIQKSLATWEFYLALNEVLVQIKDIHTRMWLPSRLDEYAQNGGYYLPLSVSYLDSDIYILEDGEEIIPMGSKLVSINRFPIDTIINKLFNLQYADGYADHISRKMLEQNFRRHLSWILSVKQWNSISYIPPDQQDTLFINYPAYHWGEWTPSVKKSLTTRKLNYFFHILSDHKTAYLRIASFSKGNSRQYKQFLKKAFRSIQESHITDLIIDLRDNRGGYVDRGSELISYLAPEPFLFVSHSVVRSSRLLSQKVTSQTNWYKFPIKPFKKPFDRKLMGCSRKLPGTYDTLYWEPQNIKNPKLHFDGNTYLLVNGLSMSNAALTHHALHRLDLATIIGEPSGCTGNATFGHAARFILPNSKLKGSISTLRIYSNRGEFEIDPYPLEPDYLVPDKLTDLIRGHDTQLTFALSLIHSSGISHYSPQNAENENK